MAKTEQTPQPRKKELAWIRDGLKAKGYSQRDLARAWSSAEASISRFIAGDELADPPLSRCVTLAHMLDITLEDLAAGLGVAGRKIEPSVLNTDAMPPVGTFALNMLQPGRVRVVMNQDVTPAVASRLVAVLGGADGA
jgi:transcriptional regulator with XRE-family HTH domain